MNNIGDAPPEMDIKKISAAGYREDFNADLLRKLAQSIEEVGLINPVALTSDYRVIDGRRRLKAFESLGYQSIPVVFPNIDESEANLLEAERDANQLQVKYTVSEMVALGAAIEARKKDLDEYRAQQGVGGGGDRRSPHSKTTSAPVGAEVVCDPPEPRERPGRRLNDAVGEVIGVSGRTYRRMKDIHAAAEGEKDDAPEVVEYAKELVEKMDSGEMSPAAADTALTNRRKETTSTFKGRGNEKKQIRGTDQLKLTLGAAADVLEAHFNEGFEKTFTPDIAREVANDLRAKVTRINKILKTIEEHAKG